MRPFARDALLLASGAALALAARALLRQIIRERRRQAAAIPPPTAPTALIAADKQSEFVAAVLVSCGCERADAEEAANRDTAEEVPSEALDDVMAEVQRLEEQGRLVEASALMVQSFSSNKATPG